MKKHSVTIVLIVTLLILIIGGVGYYKIIRPMYLNNSSQTKEIDLKRTQKVVFTKYENQGDVFGIKLEITGSTEENFNVLISSGSQDLHTAAVKGGKAIDFVYKNDWYNDSCIIELIPMAETTGSLTVDCRFLALD